MSDTLNKIIWRPILKNPVNLIAVGLGSGLSPILPGTCGTVAAIPIYWVLSFLPFLYYCAAVTLITLVGVWICGVAARNMGVHDHPAIVFDELVGYLWTMLFVPVGWGWILLGFVSFRLFDMWKPWPIRQVDRRVKGGVGIVLDDILAAIYAWIIMLVVLAVVTQL